MAREDTDTIREFDTIEPTLSLKLRRTKAAISDASEVIFTLYGPFGFANQERRLSVPGQVNVLEGGGYSAFFTIGPAGRYTVVATGMSAAGHRKSEEWTFVAEPLGGDR